MKYILIFNFLLFTSLYSANKDFSIIVHKPFNAALFDITQNYDNTISAVGFFTDYETGKKSTRSYSDAFEYLASMSDKSGERMHLLKVNLQAKILHSINTKLPRFSKAVCLVKTPSNGYFIGGHTLDGSLLVLKLDASQNILMTQTFGTKNQDRLNSLVALRDGGVLAIGSSVTSNSSSDKLFQRGLGNNDIFVTKFSKYGKKLWSKKYGTALDDVGLDGVEANDGSLIILSATSYMRLSENGNKMWIKAFKNKKHLSPHKIIKLKNNTFVLALSQTNNMQKEQIRLIQFDLYNHIIFDNIIATTYSSVLNDIKEFSDGSLMGVGYVQDAYNTDGLVMLFDSHLSMLKQEHFGGDNYDVFNALTILRNSQVAVAGIHTDVNSQVANMWLVKLNRDATIAQVALNTKSMYEILSQIYQEEIKKKSIFIGEDLSINIIDTSLYFQEGIYKLTHKQMHFLQSFAKKLMPFLHNNKEVIDTLEINGHASSEWGQTNFTARYLNNSKLSAERAYATLSYIFKNQDKKTQHLLTQILKGSANSYTKKVILNSQENKEKSRRVSFKIILK